MTKFYTYSTVNKKRENKSLQLKFFSKFQCIKKYLILTIYKTGLIFKYISLTKNVLRN